MRTIEIQISVNGDNRPCSGDTVFRQVKAIDTEGQLRIVIVHNRLHRRDGNTLIGNGQHFIGVFRTVGFLQHHRQATFLCLLLDLLGGLVPILGRMGPPGIYGGTGEHHNRQRGCQHDGHHFSAAEFWFLLPALCQQLVYHGIFCFFGKMKCVHGLPHFGFHIVLHCDILLSSSIIMFLSFLRPRDRYWVTACSLTSMICPISRAEYSS